MSHNKTIAQARIFSVAATIAWLALLSPAFAQAYVGGSGEPSVQVDLGALDSLPSEGSSPVNRAYSAAPPTKKPTHYHSNRVSSDFNDFQTVVVGGGDGDSLAEVTPIGNARALPYKRTRVARHKVHKPATEIVAAAPPKVEEPKPAPQVACAPTPARHKAVRHRTEARKTTQPVVQLADNEPVGPTTEELNRKQLRSEFQPAPAIVQQAPMPSPAPMRTPQAPTPAPPAAVIPPTRDIVAQPLTEPVPVTPPGPPPPAPAPVVQPVAPAPRASGSAVRAASDLDTVAAAPPPPLPRQPIAPLPAPQIAAAKPQPDPNDYVEPKRQQQAPAPKPLPQPAAMAKPVIPDDDLDGPIVSPPASTPNTRIFTDPKAPLSPSAPYSVGYYSIPSRVALDGAKISSGVPIVSPPVQAQPPMQTQVIASAPVKVAPVINAPITNLPPAVSPPAPQVVAPPPAIAPPKPAPAIAQAAAPASQILKVAPATPQTAMVLDQPLAIAPATKAAPQTAAAVQPAITAPVPTTLPPAIIAPATPVTQAAGLGVGFAKGSDTLSGDAASSIASLAARLKQNPDLRVELRSTASSEGNSNSKARRVSLARALAIKSSLTAQGIAEDRIDVRALSTAPGQPQTDQVDFFITR